MNDHEADGVTKSSRNHKRALRQIEILTVYIVDNLDVQPDDPQVWTWAKKCRQHLNMTESAELIKKSAAIYPNERIADDSRPRSKFGIFIRLVKEMERRAYVERHARRDPINHDPSRSD